MGVELSLPVGVAIEIDGRCRVAKVELFPGNTPGEVHCYAKGGESVALSKRCAPLAGPPSRQIVKQILTSLQAWPQDPAEVHGLPMVTAPTAFQQRLRAALLSIPPGSTATYGELARRLGTSPRAVGAGCRANPLPLLVPCHRVVAARGSGGFGGSIQGEWPRLKQLLLDYERRVVGSAGGPPVIR